MRDLSKVFQGVLLAQRDRFALLGIAGAPAGSGARTYGGAATSPEGYLLGLWSHECQRVFADKLISLEDKAWVEGTVQELCRQVHGRVAASLLPCCSSPYPVREAPLYHIVHFPSCWQAFPPELAAQAAEPLCFVDFLRDPPIDEATGEVCGPRPSAYEAVPGGSAEVRVLHMAVWCEMHDDNNTHSAHSVALIVSGPGTRRGTAGQAQCGESGA